MGNYELLKFEAKQLGINISDREIAIFKLFCDYLVENNKKFNLTAINNEIDIIIKHFLDSLTCFPFIKDFDLQGIECIDIGTGAGFPSLPLLFCTKHLNFTLLDSTKKKINFINSFLSKVPELKKRTKTVWGRAEELAYNNLYREKYNLVLARSVSNLKVLCELTLPYLKQEGFLIAMKGPNYQEELEAANKMIDVLGGVHWTIQKYNLPKDINHYLIIIKKVSPTPNNYPRKYNVIIKK